MTKDEFYAWRKSIGPQSFAANKLGISQATVSIYECGYKPIPDEIAELCEIISINDEEQKPRATGRDVYDFRVKNKLTQKQIARAMLVSHVTVCRWEIDGEQAVLSPRNAEKFLALNAAEIIDETPRDYVYGVELSYDDKEWAKQLVFNRYTGDNKPDRAIAPGKISILEFNDDDEFFAGTLFNVKRDGRLNMQQSHVIMIPTWPTAQAWRDSRPVVVLNVTNGQPRNHPPGSGSKRFRDRFEEELLRVRAERRDARNAMPQAPAPEPKPQTPLPPLAELPRPATYEEAQQQRRHYLASLRATDNAGRVRGIDLNDSPADPPADT